MCWPTASVTFKPNKQTHLITEEECDTDCDDPFTKIPKPPSSSNTHVTKSTHQASFISPTTAAADNMNQSVEHLNDLLDELSEFTENSAQLHDRQRHQQLTRPNFSSSQPLIARELPQLDGCSYSSPEISVLGNSNRTVTLDSPLVFPCGKSGRMGDSAAADPVSKRSVASCCTSDLSFSSNDNRLCKLCATTPNCCTGLTCMKHSHKDFTKPKYLVGVWVP